MNPNWGEFCLTAFVTLFVVVDPFGLAPIYMSLTHDLDETERRRILRRAILIALCITLFFLVAGNRALSYLGVSLHAFSISGGILLFITALPMLFGQRPALQSPDGAERPARGDDLAVFPLAIPLLAGPGTMTTVLLLAVRTEAMSGLVLHMIVLAGIVIAVFLTAYVGLLWSARLLLHLGESGLHIITRVMGVLLAALAVQFALNGGRDYYKELTAPTKTARFEFTTNQ